jgi:DNA mismatch endonuclease (patch repair protein)
MERCLRKFLKKGVFEDVSPERYKTMAAIRSKHNRTTEQKLKMLLVRNRISGWTSHKKAMPGNPDFFFAKKNVAIFVDGCFWHGCPRCGHLPKTRTAFWKAKIERNVERDKQKRMMLKKMGIDVIRFWEHELSDTDKRDRCLIRLKGI